MVGKITKYSQRDKRWVTNITPLSPISAKKLLFTRNTNFLVRLSVFWKVVVYFSVTGLVAIFRNKFEIFFSIVSNFAINMMNYFRRLKNSINFFTHKIPMKIYISFTVGHWVSMFKNFYISVSVCSFASVPSVIRGLFTRTFNKLPQFISFYHPVQV